MAAMALTKWLLHAVIALRLLSRPRAHVAASDATLALDAVILAFR